MIAYGEDSIQPDWTLGGTVSFGPSGVSGTVNAGAGTAPGPGCVNCGTAGLAAAISLPVVLLIVAVLVLILRR